MILILVSVFGMLLPIVSEQRVLIKSEKYTYSRLIEQITIFHQYIIEKDNLRGHSVESEQDVFFLLILRKRFYFLSYTVF